MAATATSGLPVSYGVSGPATLSGNVLTVTGPSEVILDALADGDDNAWQYSTFASVVVSPDIVVEQPAGTVLIDGTSSIDFGPTAAVSPVVKVFTIRNASMSNLTGLAISADGRECRRLCREYNRDAHDPRPRRQHHLHGYPDPFCPRSKESRRRSTSSATWPARRTRLTSL